MKIKEVSEKTNLTEKAIRLYIENGLVTPSFNETYTGRRNVEFSEENVEALKCISILRKAGFSIGEIKLMQSEPEKSKDILTDFIDKTNKRISTETEIVSLLNPLLSKDNITPELISESLNKPTVNEKTVPVEDSEIPYWQRFIKKLFFVFGIIGFIFSVLCIFLILRVEIRDINNYLYPYYDLNSNDAFLMLCAILSLILPVLIIFFNRKNEASARKKQRINAFISVFLIGFYIVSSLFTSSLAFLASIANPESYVISYTEDIENYMVFDDEDAKKAMSEFLPEKLSEVNGVKYEYYYKNYGVWHQPPRTRVSLEIPLGEENFEKNVEHYKSFRPADSVTEPSCESKNGWTLIYYRYKGENSPSNYTPIFAFNENENKVRFICEYGQVYTKGAINGIYDFIW